MILDSNMQCSCSKIGTYFNTTKCMNCNPECAECYARPDNCTSCSTNGLIHITSNKKCGFSPLDSTSSNQDTLSCWKCGDNKFYDTMHNKCKSCPDHWSRCEGEICLECQNSQMKLSDDKNSCVWKQKSYYNDFAKKWLKCGLNCVEWESVQSCNKWISDILKIDKGNCFWSKEHQYYDEDHQTCKECDSNWKHCKNKANFCTKCYDSSIPLVKGRWGWQEEGKIMNKDGECVCPSNTIEYYNGCRSICQELVFMNSDKPGRLILSNNIHKNLDLRIYLDQDHWKSKSDIRFIEWNFYEEHTGTDLNLGMVGEVGDMFISLTRELLHKLPINKDIKIVVDMKIYGQDEYDPGNNKIIDVSDEMIIKIIPSKINIVLNGHNTIYGTHDNILIDASSTYDPDIEGLHYYLPFEFQWKCPKEIQT